MLDSKTLALIEELRKENTLVDDNAMELTEENLKKVTQSHLTQENLKQHNTNTSIQQTSTQNLSDSSKKGGYCTIS